jgi:hypothetical protein
MAASASGAAVAPVLLQQGGAGRSAGVSPVTPAGCDTGTTMRVALSASDRRHLRQQLQQQQAALQANGPGGLEGAAMGTPGGADAAAGYAPSHAMVAGQGGRTPFAARSTWGSGASGMSTDFAQHQQQQQQQQTHWGGSECRHPDAPAATAASGAAVAAAAAAGASGKPPLPPATSTSTATTTAAGGVSSVAASATSRSMSGSVPHALAAAAAAGMAGAAVGPAAAVGAAGLPSHPASVTGLDSFASSSDDEGYDPRSALDSLGHRLASATCSFDADDSSSATSDGDAADRLATLGSEDAGAPHLVA